MLVLSERLDFRRDLGEKLGDWLRKTLERASGGRRVEVDKTGEGWMLVNSEDEPLLRTLIRLETDMDPVAEGKPPYTARVEEISEKSIKLAYPAPNGRTIRKTLSLRSFSAALGYDFEDPRRALEGVGVFRGSAVSIAAEAPSTLQVRFARRVELKGLDLLFVLNAAPQEVDEVLNRREIAGLIAEHQQLTLTVHVLYVRLGVGLEKAYERVRERFEELSGEIVIKPAPWIGMLRAR
ncbi:MAG: hypothetical protein J7J94_03835 [Thaumarchaeota archaeon]|nr:hypothetical protein [Nitrososphaerota archaeon]